MKVPRLAWRARRGSWRPVLILKKLLFAKLVTCPRTTFLRETLLVAPCVSFRRSRRGARAWGLLLMVWVTPLLTFTRLTG